MMNLLKIIFLHHDINFLLHILRLDNEKEVGKRFIFKVNAVQEGQISSSALVFVLVKDANDNAPIFGLQEYQFSIREDMKSGDFIGVITAEDMDSNR